MCTAKTLISLGGCPGWSRSSLHWEHRSFRWFCCYCDSNGFQVIRSWPQRPLFFHPLNITLCIDTETAKWLCRAKANWDKNWVRLSKDCQCFSISQRKDRLNTLMPSISIKQWRPWSESAILFLGRKAKYYKEKRFHKQRQTYSPVKTTNSSAQTFPAIPSVDAVFISNLCKQKTQFITSFLASYKLWWGW